HLKRIHPAHITLVLNNEEELDLNLSAGPSTFSNNSNNIQQTEPCFPSAPKRCRQLKLYGLTEGNNLTDEVKNSIDESLIKMIVTDYQPLSLVENSGFLEYSKKLQPLYKVPTSLSITTDIWTSDNNIAYLTVTCHFIFDDRLYSPVLATREMHESHTGVNIANLLSDILNEWGIKDKIISWMFLKKCRTLVGHFKHSVFASEKLKELQTQMGLPVLKVIQDVSTRWNSSIHMLDRLVQIKALLSAAMTFLPRAPDLLTALDWELITDCLPILKPFDVMTVELSGEIYPTLSSVIPLVRGLQHTLKSIITNTTAGNALQKIVIEVIVRRLGILERDKIVAKSTFLYPRFKKAGFGLIENANNTEKLLMEELSDILNNKHQEDTCSVPINSINVESNVLWKQFDTKVSQIRSTLSTGITASLIIRQYLEMPYLNRKQSPLDFWKKNKNTFPELYMLQMKYLSVPATSVPSERVFSKAGQITND
ncbi:zinc finger BED domain-containing protein 4-like, partial [Sipha flava]|uniref:Zinc finger BED domain-containing protein 4-like n=1 Tax=Sipha flava TaxID=143950 RepID=A0A8B8G6U9_9HEMI